MTVLSVNVNKIAVLRNSRGGSEPDVVTAAKTCIAAGAHGITVHPRPDQRHIRPADARALAPLCVGGVEFNIEGNAFAPPRGDYPGLLALVRETRPAQCTLVPDSDAQITSDHGFDLRADASRLKPLVADLKAAGARVSLFVDAGWPDVEIAADIGADRIEIYTGPYAHAFAAGDHARELSACVETAQRAQERRTRRERGTRFESGQSRRVLQSDSVSRGSLDRPCIDRRSAVCRTRTDGPRLPENSRRLTRKKKRRDMRGVFKPRDCYLLIRFAEPRSRS